MSSCHAGFTHSSVECKLVHTQHEKLKFLFPSSPYWPQSRHIRHFSLSPTLSFFIMLRGLFECLKRLKTWNCLPKHKISFNKNLQHVKNENVRSLFMFHLAFRPLKFKFFDESFRVELLSASLLRVFSHKILVAFIFVSVSYFNSAVSALKEINFVARLSWAWND